MQMDENKRIYFSEKRKKHIYVENGNYILNPNFKIEDIKYILDLKKNNDTAVRCFTNVLVKGFEKIINLDEFDIVTCVPFSKVGIIEEGIVRVAKNAASQFPNLEYIECLKRIKEIEKLDCGRPREKQIHYDSIIACNIDKFKNKSIILIDDIAATGNSLRACSNILQVAGAKNVGCIAIGKGFDY